MKKTIVLLIFAIFSSALLSFAADDAKKELRPSQKLMQARKAWLSGMNANLVEKFFNAVEKKASKLAKQTKGTGEKNNNPLGKKLELEISSLAKEIAAAADKQDGKTIKAKLGKISEKCSECHTKIRDKK